MLNTAITSATSSACGRASNTPSHVPASRILAGKYRCLTCGLTYKYQTRVVVLEALFLQYSRTNYHCEIFIEQAPDM